MHYSNFKFVDTHEKMILKFKSKLLYLKNYGIITCYFKYKARQLVTGKYQYGWIDKLVIGLYCIKRPKQTVAIVGCGYFSFAVIGNFLIREKGAVVKYCLDTNKERQTYFSKFFGIKSRCDNLEQILRDPEIELVYIATNHKFHTEIACKCLNHNKAVHIEKPHVINELQLSTLSNCINQNSRVFVGFNRPNIPLFKKVIQIYKKQKGPGMINWVIFGHKLPDKHWYNDNDEGSRILGNLTHWFDATIYFLSEDLFSCTITPLSSYNPNQIIGVSLKFKDNTMVTINFSALGNLSTGVKEMLNIQRGNFNAQLSDFQSGVIESENNIENVNLYRRNLGHKVTILKSYESRNTMTNKSHKHILNTAKFYLAVYDSLRNNTVLEFKL